MGGGLRGRWEDSGEVEDGGDFCLASFFPFWISRIRGEKIFCLASLSSSIVITFGRFLMEEWEKEEGSNRGDGRIRGEGGGDFLPLILFLGGSFKRILMEE